jgi:hypothetical protein
MDIASQLCNVIPHELLLLLLPQISNQIELPSDSRVIGKLGWTFQTLKRS